MKSIEKYVSRDSEYFFHYASAIAQKLFFYPVVAGRFTYLPGYELSRERYDSYLMIIVESGELTACISGKEYIVYPGQILLINCYEPHSYKSLVKTTISWIHFDGNMSKDFYEAIINSKGNILTPQNLQPIKSLCHKIIESMNESKNKCSEGDYSLMIHTLLNLMLTSENTQIIGNSENFQKVLSYINDHFSENISIDELAAIAGLTSYYFLRAFKKKTGVTPHQFIIDTRLSSAKYYLSSTDMSISDIAEKVGFSDESAFCQSFKKKNSTTPLKYRRGENYEI